MLRARALPLVVAVLFSGCTAPSSSADTTAPPPGIVTDDFNGPAGAPPDPALWDYDVGPWQDDGLQRYTTSPDNVRLDGQGHLVIQARNTPEGCTSARPVTRGKLSMRYGRVSARIKFPSGQGIWPAFWMLGWDFLDVGWPFSGEIDMMELVNNGNTYHVALHGPQGQTDYYGGVKVTDKVVGTQRSDRRPDPGLPRLLAGLATQLHHRRRRRPHTGHVHPGLPAPRRRVGVQQTDVRAAEHRRRRAVAGTTRRNHTVAGDHAGRLVQIQTERMTRRYVGPVRRWHRLILQVAPTVIAVLALAGLPVYVNPQIDELRHADAILVIGGHGFDRYPYGMTLAWQKWAPNLVLSNGQTGDTWLNRFCSEPPAEFKVYCFAPEPATTLGEARAIKKLAAEHNWHSLIVVTARPHISRARLILERCFSGEISMVEGPDPISWRRWIYEYVYQTAGFIRAMFERDC